MVHKVVERSYMLKNLHSVYQKKPPAGYLGMNLFFLFHWPTGKAKSSVLENIPSQKHAG
jgi:hypothetical protein